MTTALFVVALILALIGVIGSVLPVLPGVVFSLLALLIVEFGTSVAFGETIWVVATILIVCSIASDYVFPVLGAKSGGGTAAGTRGSMLGLIVGLFFAPRGLIAGPLIGARIGERYAKKDARHALRAARGSFLGSVGSTVVKLISSGIVVYWIIAAWI